MKKYKITDVVFDDVQVTITLKNAGTFRLGNSVFSSKLKVGDTFGIMYDNIHGIVPVGYVYHGMIDCAMPGLMKWNDRMRYKAMVRKTTNKEWGIISPSKLIKSAVVAERGR